LERSLFDHDNCQFKTTGYYTNKKEVIVLDYPVDFAKSCPKMMRVLFLGGNLVCYGAFVAGFTARQPFDLSRSRLSSSKE
jgi:hypothetical protein